MKIKKFDFAQMDNIKRSTFKIPTEITTTLNVGDLVPFHLQEIYPGDTFKFDTAMLGRMTTMLKPVMDNLSLNYYYFFVPNRIIHNEWVNVMGESKQAWYDDEVYTVPHFSPEILGGVFGDPLIEPHSLLAYFGFPQINTDELGLKRISALPIRGYKKIWNDWFRDQNLQDPLPELMGASNNNDFYYGYQVGSVVENVLKANKYHDYFTSALPSPQKGPSVFIPFSDVKIPVVAGSTHNNHLEANLPVRFKNRTDNNSVNAKTLGIGPNGMQAGGSTPTSPVDVTFSNLWADASTADAEFGAPTINALRLAFQIQRIYEKDARGGSRYVEIIRSHFGVISPDSRQQRPEFLGGGKAYMGVNQVQSTANTESGVLAEQAAYGQMAHSKFNFEKSFTEHGYVFGLVVARYKHSYAQGIPKTFSRIDRFDFYDPSLAHIGEQPIFEWEIYNGVGSGDSVFGYNEAFADLRYNPKRVTGYMSPIAQNSLAVWNYADKYTTRPYLSDAWIKEDKNNIDRTLAVSSDLAPQIILNIAIDITATRAMPLYSIPGLIDHF